MTVAEYKATLEALDEKQFIAFRAKFGGDYTTRQQYADDFVQHPEHERRLCQLLGVDTEQGKATAAAVSSAVAAQESARSSRWAMIWAALSLLAAITALLISSR